jgi:hypothetical protein
LESSVDISHWCDRVSKAKKAIGERILPMQHNETGPSYLFAGLIEGSEFRALLDEVYLYAL